MMAYGRYKLWVPRPDHFATVYQIHASDVDASEKVRLKGATQPGVRVGTRDARIRLYSVDLCLGYTSYFAARILARKRQSARITQRCSRNVLQFSAERCGAARRGAVHRAEQCRGCIYSRGEVGEMLTTTFQRLLAEIKAQPTTRNTTSISIPNSSTTTIHRCRSIIILTGTSCGDKAQSEIKLKTIYMC